MNRPEEHQSKKNRRIREEVILHAPKMENILGTSLNDRRAEEFQQNPKL